MALEESRRALHNHLRAQAQERASALLGKRPAQTLHQLGDNRAAAAMWEQHHPGAMKLWNSGLHGGGVPPWVQKFMSQQETPHQYPGSVLPGPRLLPRMGVSATGAAPGAVAPGSSTGAPMPGGSPGVVPVPGGSVSSGPGGAAPVPAPSGPSLTHAIEHFPSGAFGGSSVPIHLGGGIFLHPETGQLHGVPISNPLMNALHAVSPSHAVPAPGPAPVAF